MRKRLLLSAAAIIAIACVVLLALAMMPDRPGVTKANFDRIEKGMTLAEVERILGGGTEHRIDFGDVSLHGWPSRDGKESASVLFDGDSKVMKKGWEGSPEPWLERISRWFRLP